MPFRVINLPLVILYSFLMVMMFGYPIKLNFCPEFLRNPSQFLVSHSHQRVDSELVPLGLSDITSEISSIFMVQNLSSIET